VGSTQPPAWHLESIAPVKTSIEQFPG